MDKYGFPRIMKKGLLKGRRYDSAAAYQQALK